jgi:hypothetical protein
MSDYTVNFKINIGGNAVDGVMKLTQEVEKATSKFDSLAKFSTKIANIGFAVSHVVNVFRTANAAVGKYVDAYKEANEAEIKLAAVMRKTMDASDLEIESIKELAAEQQRLGVIDADTQVAGAQELATYLEKAESIKKVLPAMNDMIAQQYGLNASQESAVGIATMVGKVLQGQTGALSRYGYFFTEAQEKILKFGNEEQRVAVLSAIVEESVGGVNAALAATPEGKQKQIADSMGDIDERIGSLIVRLKSGFNPVLETLINKINKVIDTIEEKNIIPKIVSGIEKLTNFITRHIKAIGVIIGLYFSYVGVMKVYNVYKRIAIFLEGAQWLAIKQKVKAMRQSTIAIWQNITSQGTYLSISLLTAIAINRLTKAVWKLNASLYANPIVWIIAAIVAAVAAVIAVIVLLWKKCEGFRRVVFGVWESVKAVFHNIGVFLNLLWENIIKPIFTLIGSFFVSIWEGVTNTVSKAANAIFGFFKRAFDKIKRALMAIGEYFICFTKKRSDRTSS